MVSLFKINPARVATKFGRWEKNSASFVEWHFLINLIKKGLHEKIVIVKISEDSC
jgi:hypothetical protein